MAFSDGQRPRRCKKRGKTIALARRKWRTFLNHIPVFPVNSGRKKGRKKKKNHDRKPDLASIKAFWTPHPKKGIHKRPSHLRFANPRSQVLKGGRKKERKRRGKGPVQPFCFHYLLANAGGGRLG